ATAEEGLVQHGDLEQRDLQAADQGLERIRQGAVVEDELEQHRNQVDDVFVDLANHARLAALGADLVQQLFELALQVEVIDELRRTRLHVRQQAHQVAAGNGYRIAGDTACGQGAAAQFRKQALESAEGFVHANILGMACGVAVGCARDAAARRCRCMPLATTRRCRLEFGQDARANQCLVGFGIELVEIGQHIALEELEDDQLDLDFHTQAAARLEKVLAQRLRPERVALVIELAAHQRVHAGGQVGERKGGAAGDLGDHGVDGDRLFEFVVLYQCQVVEREVFRLRRLAYFILVEPCERLEDLLQEAALDTA